MAPRSFNFDDVLPRIPRTTTLSASTNLKGTLKFQFLGVNESTILDGFQNAINRASQRIAIDLRAALEAAMKSGVWSVPSGTDDIFDTGELMSSGEVRVTDSGVQIVYTAPYAALVHFGGYINPYGNKLAKVYLPPRPWVEAVLFGSGPVPQFDFVSYYQREIESEFS